MESTVRALKDIRRITEVNQLRLQNLEVSVTNLASICSLLHEEIRLLSLSNHRGIGKVEQLPESIDLKLPYSNSSSPPNSESNGTREVLRDHKQQLVSCISKEAKTLASSKHSGSMKMKSKAVSKLSTKKVPVTTTTAARNKSTTTQSLMKQTRGKEAQKSAVKNIETIKVGKGPAKSAVNKNMGTTTRAKVATSSTIENMQTSKAKFVVIKKRATAEEVADLQPVKATESTQRRWSQTAVKADTVNDKAIEGKSNKAKAITLRMPVIPGGNRGASASNLDDTPQKATGSLKNCRISSH
ncbi:hypothetical protein Ancab_007223 [Ancistrocladus abbreviatus]